MELDTDNDESIEYKVEVIWNSVVYAKESKSDHLSRFYYLVLWKSYSKKKNTWKLVLAMQYLKRLISLFYKNYPNKLTAIFSAINTASTMARSTIKPAIKIVTSFPK